MAKGKPKSGENKGWLKKGTKPWNFGLKGYMKGRVTSYETKKKIGEANRKLHHDTVTPVKNLIRSQMEYRLWRAKVYERDDYTCQSCLERSTEGNRKRLHAHHIKHFAEIIREFSIKTIEDTKRCSILYDITNGITLCEDCHKLAHYTGNTTIKRNGEEITWQRTEKISEKKT